MSEINTTVCDVNVRHKRKPTDEEIAEMERQEVAREQAFVRKALMHGTTKDVLHVDPIVGLERFYEVELAPKVFDRLRYFIDCYVEARTSGNNATVFVHFPHTFETKESYRAFWIRDEEVIELIEPKTIELAERIFTLIFEPLAIDG